MRSLSEAPAVPARKLHDQMSSSRHTHLILISLSLAEYNDKTLKTGLPFCLSHGGYSSAGAFQLRLLTRGEVLEFWS